MRLISQLNNHFPFFFSTRKEYNLAWRRHVATMGAVIGIEGLGAGRMLFCDIAAETSASSPPLLSDPIRKVRFLRIPFLKRRFLIDSGDLTGLAKPKRGLLGMVIE